MSDTAPRSTTAVGGLQQLGFDEAGPLPAWVLLNAVRNQGFSGEVTLHTRPAVRVWAHDGLVYWAERAGATPVADRLIELGAITPTQLAQGAVRLGDTVHLGRLFDRVPNLDRDEVVNALGFVRDSLTAEVADLLTDRADVVPHRHHTSGIVFWFEPTPEPLPAPLPAPAVQQMPAPAAPPAVLPPPVVDEQPPPDDVLSAVRLALDEIRAALGDQPAAPAPAPVAAPVAAPAPAAPAVAAPSATGPAGLADVFQSLETDSVDLASMDAVAVDTGMEYGPQPARRAARSMPTSYGEMDPLVTEQTAPVVPISNVAQPASGLRRLIGGRRG